LIAAFVPCDFVINGTIEDIEQACAQGTVVLDGVTLECPIDWRVIDQTTLSLIGDACDALQDGETHVAIVRAARAERDRDVVRSGRKSWSPSVPRLARTVHA
jgi:hypothetical protein